MKGFKKFCISNAVNGTDDDMLWSDSKEDGNVSSDRKGGDSRVIGNWKYNLTCFVYLVYENNCKILYSICFGFWGHFRFG